MSKIINCPYCHWPYIFKVPNKKGKTHYKCKKCKNLFVIAWDYIDINYLGVFTVGSDPDLFKKVRDKKPVSSTKNTPTHTRIYQEHENNPSKYKCIGDFPLKAPEKPFKIRSISRRVNYSFKKEISVTGLVKPFVIKHIAVTNDNGCNTKNEDWSITFIPSQTKYKWGEKQDLRYEPPVTIRGKIEDLLSLTQYIHSELIFNSIKKEK